MLFLLKQCSIYGQHSSCAPVSTGVHPNGGAGQTSGPQPMLPPEQVHEVQGKTKYDSPSSLRLLDSSTQPSVIQVIMCISIMNVKKDLCNL